jgi:hypothetical protein
MHLRASLTGVALAAALAMLPATVLAQDAAPPENTFITVTTFSAPFNDEGQKVAWWIDSVMVPGAKMNPNVLHFRVGGHNWGSSAGDIVMISEYADWNAINADCEACDEWFENRQPAEGTPEREAWDEAQAAFLKHYHGHQDEIYFAQTSRSK